MSKLSERIKKLRLEKGLSQEELGAKIGVQKAAIHKYENGIVVNLKRPVIDKLAQVLEVSPAYLMGWDELSEHPDEDIFITYPVVVSLKAGYGGQVQFEYSGDKEQIPSEWIRGYDRNEFFIANVKGDSMYPMFLEGDRVLVHITPSVDSGSIAAMRINGDEVTLKRVVYKPGEDWFELQPINTAYPPKRVEGKSLKECGVVGEVKRLIRKF